MTDANGLRLLLAARKSRKGTDGEEYERQDHRAREWAEYEGHAIIHTTADTASSQTAPWKRRSLGPWMTDPRKTAMYDAILISNTDRISRGTDEDFHWLETWCYENGKKILVARGPQFPARDDSDRYQWIAQKRAARTEWESIRDRHADTREVIRANGGAIGKPGFGYTTAGPKLHKSFILDPVNAPLAREAFERIADGRTGTSVVIWLSEATGTKFRLKRLIEMIQRPSYYTGERDGHKFEPLVSKTLWDNANSALAARLLKHKDPGGRRVTHGYSGLIYCECGDQLYRHKTEWSGERYRCAKGRRADVSESKCGFRSIPFDAANAAVDVLMLDDHDWEWVTVTTGGDHGRQIELQRIQGEMASAMARKDMAAVAQLAAEFSEVDSRPAEPVRTETRRTGRSVADAWDSGDLGDRRAMLSGWRGVRFVTVYARDGVVMARTDDAEHFPPYAL